MDELKSLTQSQYERLLSRLADVLQTRRNLITIVEAKRVNAVAVRYKVKRRGDCYPYLIEETFSRCGNIYLNLGVVI